MMSNQDNSHHRKRKDEKSVTSLTMSLLFVQFRNQSLNYVLC